MSYYQKLPYLCGKIRYNILIIPYDMKKTSSLFLTFLFAFCLTVMFSLTSCKGKDDPTENGGNGQGASLTETELLEAKHFTAVGIVIIPSDTDPYVKEDLSVDVLVTTDSTVQIVMNNAQFAERMPQMTIVVDSVSYDERSNPFNFFGDGLIPCMKNGENMIPVDRYQVSALEGRITLDSMFITTKFGTYDCSYAGRLIRTNDL